WALNPFDWRNSGGFPVRSADRRGALAGCEQPRDCVAIPPDDFQAPCAQFFIEERNMNRANGLTGIRALLAATGILTVAMALPAAAETDPKAVIATYADIALAGYEDALATAKALDQATDALIANPSAETLAAAREAWKAARIPYQQTEVY